jgi:hypothetical protein
VTVSTEVATLAPGVIEAGENEQLKPAGRPEHVSAIELLNEPESGVAVTVILPLFPEEIVNADGFAPKLRLPLVLLSGVQFSVNFTAFDI